MESIGAAIILLSVPLDLFYQQIVSFPTIDLIENGVNATIQRATIYDPATTDVIGSYLRPWWTGTGSQLGVQVSCPTGNCTFGPFHTLAVDYQCTEVSSDLLVFGCRNASSHAWRRNEQYIGAWIAEENDIPECGYYIHLPNDDEQLVSGYQFYENGTGEILSVRMLPLIDSINTRRYANGSLSFTNVSNPILDFIVVTTPEGFDGALQKNTPVVSECEVHWVVDQLQSTVVQGVLTEKRIRSIDLPTFDEARLWPEEHPGPFNLTNLSISDADYLATNYSLTLLDPHAPTGDTSTYGLKNWTALSIWYVWDALAPSTFTSNYTVGEGRLGQGWWKHNWRLGSDESPYESLAWEHPANVSYHMGNIVTAMNHIVRRDSLSERHEFDVVTGLAHRSEVIVDVRWPWIIFPVAIWTFAFAFLVVVICRSPGCSSASKTIRETTQDASQVLENGQRNLMRSMDSQPEVQCSVQVEPVQAARRKSW